MIAFDLDGTLVDSEGEILGGLEQAWRLLLPNEAFPRAALRIGPPLVDMVTTAAPHLSAATRDALIASFRVEYDKSDWSVTRPFPGLAELVAALAARRIPLAVATNKRRAPTLGILARWFPNQFAYVACIDRVSPDDGTVPGTKEGMLEWLLATTRTPRSAMTLVGDTAFDVRAAKAAKTRAIAVTWGHATREELAAASPDAIVSTAAELATALGV